jgi:ADP-ribose pyrophosphatase YjhB (NUDIX family)
VNPAQQLALWADQLSALAGMGLHFAGNVYDEERYAKVQTIALALMALATGDTLAELQSLRDTVYSQPTALAVGDAAVIDEAGRLLLVQRADNGLWAMPGGGFEVGETPAEGVVREALEETGVHCTPVMLAGVFDSRFCGTISRHHLYQFVFVCRPTGEPDELTPSHGHEVRQIGWFAENELPTELDPGHRTRIPVAFQVWRGAAPVFFDWFDWSSEYQPISYSP